MVLDPQREAKDLQEKFREAHRKGVEDGERGKPFEVALDEMEKGSKENDWVWYVFPQHENCPGHTYINKKYALTTREVLWFLADPNLRKNYSKVVKELKKHLESGKTLKEIVKHDVRKVISSLTLFGMIADELSRLDPFQSIDTDPMIDDFKADMEDMTELLQSVWLSLEGSEPCAYTRDALRDDDLEDEIKTFVQTFPTPEI
jgi:uncharacterized protein (DUF1810 family)